MKRASLRRLSDVDGEPISRRERQRTFDLSPGERRVIQPLLTIPGGGGQVSVRAVCVTQVKRSLEDSAEWLIADGKGRALAGWGG